MKMRQYKILTQTLLILFIINFALAAPAAVRERSDQDANVTRDVTTASQKRWDPPDEGDSTNVPGAGNAQQLGAPPPSTPPTPPGAPQPIPDSTGWVQRGSMVPYSPNARPLRAIPLGVRPPSSSLLRLPTLGPWPLSTPPLGVQPPGASPPHVPALGPRPLSALPLGVQPPSASSPLRVPALGPRPPSALPLGVQPPSASPLRVPALRPRPLRFKPQLPRPPGAPSSSAPPPGLQRQRPGGLPSRLPLPSARPPSAGDSTDLYQKVRTAIELGRYEYLANVWRSQQPQALQHPGSSTENVLPSPRPPTMSQLRPGLSGMRVGSMPGASSSTPLPPSTPASRPGPSEDRFPPGFSPNAGASSSTGNQPGPVMKQETHSVPSAEDQPNPGVMQETHSVPGPSAEELPPDFWDDVWKELPNAFQEAFSKSNIKPRIFHQQDDLY